MSDLICVISEFADSESEFSNSDPNLQIRIPLQGSNLRKFLICVTKFSFKKLQTYYANSTSDSAKSEINSANSKSV